MKPLALTDTQMQMIRKASACLKPKVRPLFLQIVAQELADVDPVDDAAVRAAVDLVFGVARTT